MTQISFDFENYPMRTGRGVRLFRGTAEIELLDTLVWRDREGDIRMPRPQRALRWGFRDIVVCNGAPSNFDDLARFIRGRYWPHIETRLCARCARENGLISLATAYEAMAQAQVREAAA